jgi:hypothetical protein
MKKLFLLAILSSLIETAISDELHLCAQRRTGVLRLSDTCRKNESPIVISDVIVQNPQGYVEASLKLVDEINTLDHARKLAEKHGFEIFDYTKTPAKYRMFFIRGPEEGLEGLKSEAGVDFVEKHDPLFFIAH